jgi:hypothetical protein
MQKVNFDIGSKLANFLATGNLVSPTGLDLQQAAGFTIVAEKLNWYRYISHFRCVHRGAFFAELKTTTVRKLLPESWGTLLFVSYGPANSLGRIHLPRPHSRWLTLWTTQSSFAVMSNRHPSDEISSPPGSTLLSWYDTSIHTIS